VPGGNANVFARALGLPASPVEATGLLLDALRTGQRRSVSLGRPTTAGSPSAPAWAWTPRWSAGRGQAGRRRQGDPGLFVRQGVTQFFLHGRRRQPAITVHADGREPEQVGLALVCNSDPWTYLGPRPVRPCPDASFDLGLDLFGPALAGHRSARLRHLRQILAATRGRPAGRCSPCTTWTASA
jgi:diacylglycerol kinase family enzyme